MRTGEIGTLQRLPSPGRWHGGRADTLLAERRLGRLRSAAAESVRAGRVRIGADGPSVAKPSQMLPRTPSSGRLGPEFASRGGVKLSNALRSCR